MAATPRKLKRLTIVNRLIKAFSFPVVAALLVCSALAQLNIQPEIRFLTEKKPNAWTASIAYPVFKGDTAVVALANDTLLKRAHALLADFLSQSKANYMALGHGGMEAKSDVSISLVGTELLSGVMTSYAFVGGAHGMTHSLPFNFALVSGKPKEIRFGDIFKPGVGSAVSQRVFAKLAGVERAAWVQDGQVSQMTPEQLDRFVITRQGVKFLFDRYELGPYSAGDFNVTLLFSEIDDLTDAAGALRFVNR